MLCCVLKLQASLKRWVNIILLSTSADVWVGCLGVCGGSGVHCTVLVTLVGSSSIHAILGCVCVWVCVCADASTPSAWRLVILANLMYVYCAFSWPLSESIGDLITSQPLCVCVCTHNQALVCNRLLNTLTTTSFSEQYWVTGLKKVTEVQGSQLTASDSLGVWLVRW